MTPDDRSQSPVDLSSLQARDARGAQDRVVAAVMSHIYEGAARQSVHEEDAFGFLERRAPFILAAAAVVAVVAGTLVVREPNDTGAGVAEPAPPSVSSALGIDPTIATWIRHANALPSAAEVVAAVRDLP